MPIRNTFSIITVIILSLSASVGMAQVKKVAKVTPITNQVRVNLVPATRLATADTCLVTASQEITHKINDWVIGNELYKNYLDPSVNCPNPYPYTITAVNMPMYFDAGTNMTVSVDIESVDTTTLPGCNVPGAMLSISTDWDITIPPEGGFYDIWIPLDTPLVVNGPFFAGFFIGTEVDPMAGAAVVIDSTQLTHCVSFNIWDTEIGYIDLLNNEIWNFPGLLILYVSGFTGGGTGSLAPAAILVAPLEGQVLYGSSELWAVDQSDAGAVDYASFEYSSGGAFTEIGRDFDGNRPLRNGLSPTVAGNGLSIPWSFTGLEEGEYTLRVTIYDTTGQYDSEEITVYLEPTPPLPRIVSPNEDADFCSPLKLVMACADENISYIQVDHSPATANYTSALTTLFQNSVGDANGNPLDGNRTSAGEFGDVYNGPVAAAIAARLWFDRGYTSIMKDGNTFLSTELLAENLAVIMNTREHGGAYDEDMYYGLTRYFATHGNDLVFDYDRHPAYDLLRKWTQAEERAVLVGLGGSSGFWLAIDGFKGWPGQHDSASIIASVPMTGALMTLPVRTDLGFVEIFFNDDWYVVELAISMLARNWEVERTVVGVDFYANDGWSLTWIPDALVEDELYYFRAWTQDGTGYEGEHSTILKFNCSQVFKPGDFNNDNLVDMFDLTMLIDFITKNGTPPEGGAGRADTNCDNLINPADIVYFMNYLYGRTIEPCH